MRHRRRLRALALPALAVTVALAGCSPEPATKVTQPGELTAEEDTASLTPLERGQIRTAILKDVREAIAAWLATDLERMRVYMAPDVVAKFEETWTGYDSAGESIVHVHDLDYLDVIDMNDTGTQALVTYRYDDDSYLVDPAGARTGELEPFSAKEMQLTVERNTDGEMWTIVRIITSEDAYR